MAFVDTNILVYGFDSRGGEKHERAVQTIDRLIAAHELVVSAQILNELTNVLLSKRKLDRGFVSRLVEQVRCSALVLPLTGDVTALALGPGMDAGLSFWDALVWATAHANRIDTVITEDFAHDRVVEGVRFIDPFRQPLSTSKQSL